MKLTVNAKALAEAVAAVAQAVAQRTTKPVLANVKVEVRDDGTVTVAATDTEVSVRRVLDGEGEEGAVLLDPKKVGDWLKEQTGTVTVERDESGPFLHTGKGRKGKDRLELADMDPAEFPDVSADGGQATFTIPAAKLVTMIERTVGAADKKEGARWACQGELFRVRDGRLSVVATDTRRLAHMWCPAVGPDAESLVPLKAVLLVAKNAADVEGDVAVTLTPNSAVFRTDGWTIHTRLVEGKFPPFEKIIPKNLEHAAEVVAAVFARSVRAAAVGADDQTRRVEFHFNDERCRMTGRSEGYAGESECDVPGFDGDVTLAMDPTYVLDGLKAMDKASVVTIRMTDDQKPVLFQTGDDYTLLIMPLGQRE